jgi:hypothetical protein
MFALSHQESLSAETRSASPVTHARPAHLWAVRAATFALAVGVAAGTVLVGSHVAFAQSPIGGTAGLFALYATTIAVGIGLAALLQLRALANRLTETLTPPAKVISLLPPAHADVSEPEWRSRPFNAA